MKLKKLLSAFILTLTLSVNLSANEVIPIRLNNEETNINAVLIGTTTYVDLAEIQVNLSKATGTFQEITALSGDLYIFSRGRYIGGAENQLINEKIYVPIRSVAKIYNTSVEWKENSRSVDLFAAHNDGIEPGESFYISDEVEWLSRIINAEAESEPLRGKILVGNVILNRMRSDEFPNTIYDVIFDRRYGVQFSPTVNGSIYKTPTEESIIAAKICLDAYYISTDILYFLNPDIATNFWIPNNRKFIMKVGSHEFYS